MSNKRKVSSQESTSMSSITPSSSDEMLNVFQNKRSRLEQRAVFDTHHSNLRQPVSVPLNAESAVLNSMQRVHITPRDNIGHIQRTLSTLGKDQLVEFICSLMDSPIVSQHILQALPKPSIEAVSTIFATLHQKLVHAFPYSKQGADVSDYSFNRVRPILVELKEAILYYLDHFTNVASYPNHLMHEFPDNAINFLNLATSTVHRLPDWTSPDHNEETKNSVYRLLSAGWAHAFHDILRYSTDQNKAVGFASVNAWAQSLNGHVLRVEGNFGYIEVWNQFIENFGWLMSGDLHSFGH